MTELRRRMDDDMQVRGMADRTRETYLWAVSGLAAFYHRSPDLISDAEIQAYLLHLIRERRRLWSTCDIVVQALRFLYHTTLKRDRMTFSVPSPRRPGTLPAILGRAEVERLIAHVPNLRHRTMILTTDAAGLRLSEVLHLRVTDIDAARMTIRVEQGKGGKDRYTVLSRRLLAALRAYWPVARPTPWLFPSTRRPHLLEAGVDIHTIQRLLGHGHISTTTRYFQLTQHTEMGSGSPLDLLERFAPPPQG